MRDSFEPEHENCMIHPGQSRTSLGPKAQLEIGLQFRGREDGNRNKKIRYFNHFDGLPFIDSADKILKIGLQFI